MILRLGFVFIFIGLTFPPVVYAQDTIKFETIKSIRDIPHATPMQVWMWPHRTAAFFFMRETAVRHDTSYYSSYKTNLVVTLPISTRFINFELRDGKTKNSLQFVPNSQYDLGVSINSKFASFLINTGVSFEARDGKYKGKTSYQDYQFNLYGKKSTIDFSLQTYKGFYIRNSNSFEGYFNKQAQPYEVRSDLSAYSLNYSHYYIFNNKKLSYRSSFAFTERQKKSAGSFLCGGYLSMFGIEADSSLISSSFQQHFDSSASVKKASVLNAGINLGYIYIFVIKKFHITLSLVQGLGVNQTNTTNQNAVQTNGAYRYSSKQNLRIALGYDTGKFFVGTMGLFDAYFFDDKNSTTFNYSYGKVRLFIGYRFPVEKQQRRLLQKLNLIDYRL